MGEIKKDEVLAKVTPDRRQFVETLLALAGYATPTVRSFLMASAMTPVFAGPSVTTTPHPTTTSRQNGQGQNGQGQNGQGNQGQNAQGNQDHLINSQLHQGNQSPLINNQLHQGNQPRLIDSQMQRTGPRKR